MSSLLVRDERYSIPEVVKSGTRTREAVAFCPRCKALLVLWFSGDKLMPTRKFSQDGREVYHDCGSSQPCRLYHSW